MQNQENVQQSILQNIILEESCGECQINQLSNQHLEMLANINKMYEEQNFCYLPKTQGNKKKKCQCNFVKLLCKQSNIAFQKINTLRARQIQQDQTPQEIRSMNIQINRTFLNIIFLQQYQLNECKKQFIKIRMIQNEESKREKQLLNIKLQNFKQQLNIQKDSVKEEMQQRESQIELSQIEKKNLQTITQSSKTDCKAIALILNQKQQILNELICKSIKIVQNQTAMWNQHNSEHQQIDSLRTFLFLNFQMTAQNTKCQKTVEDIKILQKITEEKLQQIQKVQTNLIQTKKKAINILQQFRQFIVQNSAASKLKPAAYKKYKDKSIK